MNNEIKEIVEGLIEMSDTRNPFEICEYLGIILLYEDLGPEILGYYQKTESNHEILHINNQIDETLQQYICSHELGHAVLEPDISLSFFIENPLLVKNKPEINADKFAAELLLDDSLGERYPTFTLEQIAAAENVPLKLVKLKLSNIFLA